MLLVVVDFVWLFQDLGADVRAREKDASDPLFEGTFLLHWKLASSSSSTLSEAPSNCWTIFKRSDVRLLLEAISSGKSGKQLFGKS